MPNTVILRTADEKIVGEYLTDMPMAQLCLVRIIEHERRMFEHTATIPADDTVIFTAVDVYSISALIGARS